MAPCSWLEQFQREGFLICNHVLAADQVNKLIQAIESARTAYSTEPSGKQSNNLRNLVKAVPQVRELANSNSARSLVEPILGTQARVVRGLFFDKTPETNWKVAWHQDLAIAVKERRELPGFGPWTTKAGVLHVLPPASVLENMVTLRFHLDECSEQNGPLQVLPGSHLNGRLEAPAIAAWREKRPVNTCPVSVGGVLILRPLLLHASSEAQHPGHRRVVHLEYAADRLPEGLEWALEMPCTFGAGMVH